MATTPNLAQSAGIPTQWTEALATSDKALITGHEPAVMTKDELVADSTVLSALHVVGFNASKELVPAVWDATYAENGVRPVGIAVLPITVATPSSQPGIPTYRAGCFNPDALVWDASFGTEAKKMSAFEGAPAPTNIILRRPKQATV